MRFSLIDRITDLQPGVRITAVKSLSLAEEYLMDHFPRFPVMPGVLMLEALYQASAWLVRHSEGFTHSAVVLTEAKGVRYADFVQPGQTLTLTAEITGQDERHTRLTGRGTVGDRQAVSARLVLSRYNFGESDDSVAADDQYTRSELKKLFDVLYRPEGSPSPNTSDSPV